MVSHIGPTNSCLFLTILLFFLEAIILCYALYKAGLIKSFIAASKIIKFILLVFLIYNIFVKSSAESAIIDLPGSKIIFVL